VQLRAAGEAAERLHACGAAGVTDVSVSIVDGGSGGGAALAGSREGVEQDRALGLLAELSRV
jgi:hypothetical protein